MKNMLKRNERFIIAITQILITLALYGSNHCLTSHHEPVHPKLKELKLDA